MALNKLFAYQALSPECLGFTPILDDSACHDLHPMATISANTGSNVQCSRAESRAVEVVDGPRPEFADLQLMFTFLLPVTMSFT